MRNAIVSIFLIVFTYSDFDRESEWWLGFDTANYNASKWNRKDTTEVLLKLVEELRQVK